MNSQEAKYLLTLYGKMFRYGQLSRKDYNAANKELSKIIHNQDISND